MDNPPYGKIDLTGKDLDSERKPRASFFDRNADLYKPKAFRVGPVPDGTGKTGQPGSPGQAEESPSPVGSGALPLPHRPGQIRLSATEKRAEALAIYERLGAQFNANFKTQAAKAHRELIIGIRENQSVLVDAGLYTAKELDDRCDELEAKLRKGGDEGQMTMIDHFHKWLNEPPQEVTK